MNKKDGIEDVLIKHILGESTEEENSMVVEWLKVKENVDLYKNLKKDIRRFSDLRSKKAEVDVDAAWKKTVERLELEKKKGKVIPLFFQNPAVLRYAAAAILIILGLYSVFKTDTIPKDTPLMAQEDSIKIESIPIKKFEKIISANRIEKVNLNDGSQVTLRENTKLRHQLKEEDSLRKIFLDEGEAYFEVARMESKPFLVKTSTSLIRVLGTKFNVLKKNNGDVEVTVTEGLVRVYADSTLDSGEYVDLKKGEKAIRTIKGLIKVEDFNLNGISWITGHLRFNNTPMKDVVADLERHFKIEMEVEDLTFFDCRLTAKFKNQNLEAILESLKLHFGIDYEIRGELVLIKGKGCLENA